MKPPEAVLGNPRSGPFSLTLQSDQLPLDIDYGHVAPGSQEKGRRKSIRALLTAAFPDTALPLLARSRCHTYKEL